MREALYSGLLSEPTSSARGVLADWLEERGEPDANFHRWLYLTERRPIYLPTGHQYWLSEKCCAAPQFTLPKQLLLRVNSKAKEALTKHCVNGNELDDELAAAFNLSSNGLLGRIFRSQFNPSDEPLPAAEAPDCKLTIMRDESYNDGYSVQEVRRETNLDAVLLAVMGTRNAGGPFIAVKLDKWHFPAVDADKTDLSTERFCQLNGIGYLKVQSSVTEYSTGPYTTVNGPSNLWYVLDVPCTSYKLVLQIAQHISENDVNFIRTSNARGYFNLRGERRAYRPEVLENTMQTPIGQKFAEKWIQYWKDGRIDEIYRWRSA